MDKTTTAICEKHNMTARWPETWIMFQVRRQTTEQTHTTIDREFQKKLGRQHRAIHDLMRNTLGSNWSRGESILDRIQRQRNM